MKMKRWIATFETLLLLLLFAACSGSAGGSTDPKDALSFLQSGQIYIDIRLKSVAHSGLLITAGDQTFRSSGKGQYRPGDKFAADWNTTDESTVYFAIVAQKDSEYPYSIVGVCTAAELAGKLQTDLPAASKGRNKIYLLITDSKTGYDHSLSGSLNALLEASIL